MLLLEADELYRFFHKGEEEVKALRGVNFTLNPGEVVALVGPSGSGKSTLLACLAGIDEPDGGMVKAMSFSMSRKPELEKTRLRAAHIGVLLQRNNLISHLTVLENVCLVQSMQSDPDPTLAQGLLLRVGMKARSESLPLELSGGERARAGLAVALANSPPILLLDEPTGEVDAQTEVAILEMLQEFALQGKGIVIATHNAAVSRIARRIVHMRDGRIFDA